MSEFQELLAVDHKRALQFFYEAIKENIPKEVADHKPEIVHCASVMASFAQTSVASASGETFPVAMSLSQFFDMTIMDASGYRPAPEDHVHLGGQLLFLSGFFRDQFRRRNNLDWYDKLGAGFYQSAGRGYLKNGGDVALKQADFCYRMSNYYVFWAHTFQRVSRSFRENHIDPRVLRFK